MLRSHTPETLEVPGPHESEFTKEEEARTSPPRECQEIHQDCVAFSLSLLAGVPGSKPEFLGKTRAGGG